MSTNTKFVHLPSNSTDYPDNAPNKFRVRLPTPLRFDGTWMVGLHSITFAYSWPTTVGTVDEQAIDIHLNVEGKNVLIHVPIGKASLKNVDELNDFIGAYFRKPNGRVPFSVSMEDSSVQRTALTRTKRSAVEAQLSSPPRIDEPTLRSQLPSPPRIDEPVLPSLPQAGVQDAKKPKPDPPSAPKSKPDPPSAPKSKPDPPSAPKSKPDPPSAPKPKPDAPSTPKPISEPPSAPKPKPDASSTSKSTKRDLFDTIGIGSKKEAEPITTATPQLKSPPKVNILVANYSSITEDENEPLLLPVNYAAVLNSVDFQYQKEFGRFTVVFKSDYIKYISITEQLGYVLGFENPQRIENGETGKYGCDLRGGFSSFAVYSKGLIEPSILGNSLSSLLRVVCVTGVTPGEYAEKIYDSPIYARVMPKEVAEIDIELRTMDGRLVPFSYGTVMVVLIFKKTINF